jgi:hypothetical protein
MKMVRHEAICQYRHRDTLLRFTQQTQERLVISALVKDCAAPISTVDDVLRAPWRTHPADSRHWNLMTFPRTVPINALLSSRRKR